MVSKYRFLTVLDKFLKIFSLKPSLVYWLFSPRFLMGGFLMHSLNSEWVALVKGINRPLIKRSKVRIPDPPAERRTADQCRPDCCHTWPNENLHNSLSLWVSGSGLPVSISYPMFYAVVVIRYDCLTTVNHLGCRKMTTTFSSLNKALCSNQLVGSWSAKC